MAKKVFAICAHPDDIEFMMAGTLLQLQKLGYEVHYMTIASGSLGSAVYGPEELAAMRRQEAMNSCKVAGFHFHESLVPDLEILYDLNILSRLVPVVREVDPEIIFTHGLFDYMEDHVNAGRLAVSAAFARGMMNFKCVKSPIRLNNCCVYHSLPLSLVDQYNKPIMPDVFVDVGDVMETKRAMLNCHKSQKEWLDETQGLDAYLDDMQERCRKMGKLCGFCQFAEGWIRHNPIGLCAEDFDPLAVIAKPAVAKN